MKNFKKILIVVCICAILFAGCAVVALATDEYTGTVEELGTLVDTAEAATTATSKLKALEDVSEYLSTTPVDPEADGYAETLDRLHTCVLVCFEAFVDEATADSVIAETASSALDNADKAFGLFDIPETVDGYAAAVAKYDAAVLNGAALYLAKIDADILTTLATADNHIAMNRYNAFVKKHTLKASDPSVAYADLDAQYSELSKAHDAAVAINFAALDAENDISDYDLPVYHMTDWENATVRPTDGKAVNNFNFVLNGTTNPMGIGQEANGNKYVYSGYAQEGNANTYFYINLAGSNKYSAENGYIISFDITSFDRIPNGGIDVEAGGFDMPDGRGFPPFFLKINEKGDLCTFDPSGVVPAETLYENAIVIGEWLHVVIVFDPVAFEHTLIIDGQVIASYSVTYKGQTFDLALGTIRFGSKSMMGSYAMDNFQLISGSNYRNLYKFEQMTPEEKMIYYSNYFSNEEKDVNERNTAYTLATELISKYWTWTDKDNGVGQYTDIALADPDLKAAVDQYLEFDFDSLLVLTKTANLEKYIQMVTELRNTTRSLDTVLTRQESIKLLDDFALTYADLIDKEADIDGDGSAEYGQYNAICRMVMEEVNYDSNASLFIRHMNRFAMVDSLSALKRYYNRAKGMISDGLIDISLATNPDHPDRANFPEFIAAYELYVSAAAQIAVVQRHENSKTIVGCIGMINSYVTEEDWLANSEIMNKYLNIVHDIVSDTDADGNLLYDVEYQGIEDAMKFYNEAYAYFYARSQDEHVAYLSNVLDLIATTEAYIEKMGMVAMIDRYLAANEIDYNDARIISIVNDVDTCRAELELRREDYAMLLRQNAVYFINVVEYMRTAQTYTEQKKYLDDASVLYFNIDITVEGAANAALIYEEYLEKLTLIEESTLAFITAVDVYKTFENEDDKYAALVECYYYSQFVELSYEGAAEAMEFYLAEYNSYMNYAETVNAEIVSAGNAVGSLRSNCGITPVIAIIIKKVFED